MNELPDKDKLLIFADSLEQISYPDNFNDTLLANSLVGWVKEEIKKLIIQVRVTAEKF